MPTKTTPNRLSDAQALGQAIKRIRKAADLTQEEAAAKAEVAVQSWRRYEWGERDLTLDKIGRIADALGASRDQLLEEQRRITGDRPSAPPSPSSLRPRSGATVVHSDAQLVLLPIRDRVQAGAWLLADDFVQDLPRTYPAARDPRFPQADQWLSEVVGDSVNQLGISDGDLVHCVDTTAIGYFVKTGDVVEVERLRFQGSERELTLKQVEVTPEGVLLWPRSTNPRWGQPLRLTDEGQEGEDIEVRIRGLVIAAIRRF